MKKEIQQSENESRKICMPKAMNRQTSEQTGFPSIDKPWRQYYTEKELNIREIPRASCAFWRIHRQKLRYGYDLNLIVSLYRQKIFVTAYNINTLGILCAFYELVVIRISAYGDNRSWLDQLHGCDNNR